MNSSERITENPIRGEIYSVERLEEYAAYLAGQLKISDNPKTRQLLLPRMKENGIRLLVSYRAFTEALYKRDRLPPAAEWLIDNFHIVEDQLREIKEDLPPRYYKELPKIANGDLAGYPRIYAIALALVAHTDSHLETEVIRRFVDSYQKISPLSIGELWALPITLRLVLIENLRRIAVRIVLDQEKTNLANKYADQLFVVAGDSVKFQKLASKLSSFTPHSLQEDYAFTAQIAKRLRDQEPELWPALEYLEKDLLEKEYSIEDAVNLSHQLQASNQVTIANIITSMRLISSLNWQKFFESVSLVDCILNKDIFYKQMDFVTRDRYRGVIERIGKKTGMAEIAIAEKAISFSEETKANVRQSHVGYYLIGAGLKKLEKQFCCGTDAKILRFMLARPNLVYFGLFGTLLIMTGVVPLYYSFMHSASAAVTIGIGLLILLPCSDLAISIANLVLTHAIKPRTLPKLDLSRGVPENGRTMVVIPCMLSDSAAVHGLIEKIEIHFLGNADRELFFALLTDFIDAPTESMLEDDSLLKMALDGIAKLNAKYGAKDSDRFFLFHRKRKWNFSEKVWMGWERKRGKIHEFNRLLRSSQGTSFAVVTAPADLLPTIRFVITLDADTQLPRDSARKLIGTILHPLNQPHFDQTLGRVTEGYGILQPRIGISLESSNRSLFSKIFSGYIGIDPYTTAVSDVYQDLFQEGSYVGKGLYDVDAFEAALNRRIPENTVLSHDLLEGLYARTALVTDVELLDDYPQSYYGFFTRQHRWTRGDWQIGRWIFPFVKNENRQRLRNQLPLISRWKIFDNLRRSLLAPSLFLWFILAWTAFPGSLLFWVACGLSIIILPSLAQAGFLVVTSLLENRSVRISTAGVKTETNILQAMLYTIFLAHQAYIQLDAIARVFYRTLISKTKLLEWTAAAQTENRKSSALRPVWQRCWVTDIVLVGLAVLALSIHRPYVVIPIFFTLLWLSYSFVAEMISRGRLRKVNVLSNDDHALMKRIARKTWHYFETFVTQSHNWLPPDNHQELPHPATADRTSPTNIGLYLLSLTSAHDFGFLSTSRFIELVGNTIDTMRKLEQYDGHYLNWYDTKTLHALSPKYVSTVDSGNLAAHFLAVRQSCLELPNFFIIDTKFIQGLCDTLLAIENEMRETRPESRELLADLKKCQELLLAPIENRYSHWAIKIENVIRLLQDLRNNFSKLKGEIPEQACSTIEYLTDSGLFQAQEVLKNINVVAPWVNGRFSALGSQLSKLSLNIKWETLLQSFERNISLLELSLFYETAIEQIQGLLKEIGPLPLQSQNLSGFLEYLKAAKAYVLDLLNKAEAAAQFFDVKFKEMNFGFLIDKDRGIFSIGFDVTNNKFDKGLYDLLGSEARLASFIAIAKRDVPQEHWFKLGRRLVPVSGGRALVSWTASMFEYLMPLLVMRDYENTLLDETSHAVVTSQINYGNQRHVPWGVSEAGYNARDLQFNYQYGPFGIPGLGLKRGLSHDLVISPYSTLLAAMVNPVAALENLKRLIDNKLLARYGFYESVDYTKDRLPANQKSAVIKSFMAHHQGMGLVSINNMINDNIVQNRFHSDPRVRATRLLLQERIPVGIEPIIPNSAEIELDERHHHGAPTPARRYTDPNSSTPRVQLLSNRNYSVMISAAGGGYSKCGDIAVTRWNEDPTRDNSGSFIFVRDHTQAAVWSTSYQPIVTSPDHYEVIFAEEKVEFQRRDGDISTHTQILVAPEDNVEIRYVILTNHSGEPHILELTSYLEPVLGSLAEDLDHPAFSKLFIQTEYLASKNAILARRRTRSKADKENWGLHAVVTDGETISPVQYETDRSQFIGRGRSLIDAIVLLDNAAFSNTCGESVDPIFALRIKIRLPAGGEAKVAFTTGVTSSREEALGLADRYHDIHSFDREYIMAWTKSQVDMRHFNIESEDAYLYQRLAERILYCEPSLKSHALKRDLNTNLQSSLWPNGISGDLPIVVVRISDQGNIAVVRKLLRCQEYLRLKGLVYDFIILNEHPTTYFQYVQDELVQLVRSTGSQELLNRTGGVFVLRSDITPDKDIAHVQSVARISLSADEPLKDQINRKVTEEKYPELLSFTFEKNERDDTMPDSQQLSSEKDLDFFNGLGGFSQDGREYIIKLKAGQWTPLPWINVIGNRIGFGFEVSESGSGFTWAINSQTNRLTPWSNDPICDPSGEIIYLRDDETGELWSSTPLPIRTEATYTIKHGQGYSVFEHTNHGIQHSLTLFIPQDDPIKIFLLNLKNLTKRKRRITVTSYTEWVLGTQRQKTAAHLICDVDKTSGTIFARNPHDEEFATEVAFADMSCKDTTFTCSRSEFLGRNGSYANPAALRRTGLSQKTGTGQDPCSAIQSSIELAPAEEHEIVILLGQAVNIESARELVRRYRDRSVIMTALTNVKESWENILNKVQVKTPDPAMNVMMNRWLLYQTLSCRYWARTAFYQSGGAYGFRDQLQDCMTLVYSAPNLAREHILRSSERQFKEGDVQHWWHPPTGRGIRTRISDDLLWLPFVVSYYVKVTGDSGVLGERTPFLEAPLLRPEEEDSYTLPNKSGEAATIFEHCMRAINHSLSLGQHDLPLMGTGDWNDGMNRVGSEGRGESIWLGWFLHKVLSDFLSLCGSPEQNLIREKYESHMRKLEMALEKNGWDGDWYKRAYFDDGTSLGSVTHEECKIDSIAQSWAVLSGIGDRVRAEQALKKVTEFLVRKESQLILLLSPPFDKSGVDPGYIKGYVPGVRENGGQYTHAAVWVVMAYAKMGNGNKSFELFNLLNPVLHSRNESGSNKYKIEPYVMAGDVYSGGSHDGRGGWSWYTGSASWYYRAGLESILGFNLRGKNLRINPCIPESWPGYEISYKYGRSEYLIKVINSTSSKIRKITLEMDGLCLLGPDVPLVDDGGTHQVTVTLSNDIRKSISSSVKP